KIKDLFHKASYRIVQLAARQNIGTIVIGHFLDRDPLPPYEQGITHRFSGKRIKRGLYKSGKGLVNADVNGAANILRKVVPTASAHGIEGLDGTQSVNVSTPLVLHIR
ncbi:RNA-guided endonuclease TnpB family protein, partial [Brevibacillus sp. B_LB10_24]